MVDEKEMVTVKNSDGTTMEVELVTYLITDDQTKSYLVYSKGEKTGADDDEVIYISRVVKENDVIKLIEIVDDFEWLEVQRLLRKIANS